MVWAAALILAVAPPQAATDYFDTGNGLLASCAEPSGSFKRSLCAGFISGVQSVLVAQGHVCAPSGVTNGQVTDVALNYIRNDAASRHLSATYLVTAAFIFAWPCKKS